MVKNKAEKTFLEELFMCKKAEKERLLEHLNRAMYRINSAENMCKEFANIDEALQDEKTQIAIIHSIDILYKGYGITKSMFNLLSKNYVDRINLMRVASSHDFDELGLDEVKDIIINALPQLKIEIQNIIDNFDNFEIYIVDELAELEAEIEKIDNKADILNRQKLELQKRREELQQELNNNEIENDKPRRPGR